VISQRTNNDCGPVAIVNFNRWAGGKWSHADIPLLRYALITKGKGTTVTAFAAFIDSVVPGRNIIIGHDHRPET